MLVQWFTIVITALASLVAAQGACVSSTFNNIELYGGQILSVVTTNLTNVNFEEVESINFLSATASGVNLCEVNVTYTHPGQNDTILVTAWLPQQGWNGRYMAIGGGGFATGQGTYTLVAPVTRGYAAAFTNGGHSTEAVVNGTWAYIGPGNLNYALIQDYAAVALNDLAIIGKAVTAKYYGSAPRYSYWNGCSTGGRQGHMMAQRYGTQFNGILATAPAINFGSFVPGHYWPQFVMNQIGKYPRTCEFDAITAAAVAACDGSDGKTDGIISGFETCTFDPMSVVGKSINCTETGGQVTISEAAAMVANATWEGPRSSTGKFQWYGLGKGAPLGAVANTTCTANGTCVGVPFPIVPDYINLFVLRNANFNLTNITHATWDMIFRLSNNQYASILGTADPDLTTFREAGGKMITWHGLNDQLIPPGGTYDYYNRVQALDPNVRNYYRFFPTPGILHCAGGPGGFPATAFQALVSWVENGTAPASLDTVGPVSAAGVATSGKIYPY